MAERKKKEVMDGPAGIHIIYKTREGILVKMDRRYNNIFVFCGWERQDDVFRSFIRSDRVGVRSLDTVRSQFGI